MALSLIVLLKNCPTYCYWEVACLAVSSTQRFICWDSNPNSIFSAPRSTLICRPVPGLFSKPDLALLGPSPTIRGIGGLYSRRRKMSGFANAWVGKAFEYAVAELFNRRMKSYYSLICEGIDRAMSLLVSDRVYRGGLDLDHLSCVRVAKGSTDAKNLVAEFGRFRLLRDARRGLESTARIYPGLEDKVDIIFCERKPELTYRFAVLTSLKIGRRWLVKDNVRRVFRAYPIDLAVTIETPRYRGVMFDKELGVYVVYLALEVPAGVYAWERATTIVETALREGDKNAILRVLRKWFLRNTPEYHWTQFLADRLDVDLRYVVQEIRQTLPQPPRERTETIPVLLGPEKDTVLDLGVDVAA